MNRSFSALLTAVAWMLCLPAQAGLVRVGPESPVSLGGENLNTPIAYDVNTATGDYAVCYTIDMGTFDRIFCRHFDAAGALQGPILQLDYPAARVISMDIGVADDGNFYAAVMTFANSGGVRHGWLNGWTRSGSALFAQIEIDASLNWLDLAMAVTPTGPWVAATNTSVAGDIRVSAHAYLTNGAPAGTTVLGLYPSQNLAVCNFDRSSDIAANRSGDVLVTWVRPQFNNGCQGTILARTLRAGGASSADRQVTTIVRDGMGRDVSPNYRPHVGAIDNGQFVLAWGDPPNSRTATLDYDASFVVPAAVVMPGDVFEFAVDASTGDFALITKTVSCELKVQLAIEGDLVPQTRFDAGNCFNVDRFAIQFLPNGQLGVARSHFDRATLSGIALPAQIEVNNVIVAEGDPASGAPPVAAISATLTKPHPNGEDVQVSYFTRNGTAVAGQDFALTHDTAVFSGVSGETARILLLPIHPDTRYEDDEGFTVEFELPVNAVIRKGEERANVTIRDDDDTPPIAPDCDNDDPLMCRTVPEPGPAMSTEVLVTLELEEPVGVDLQISYTTADGTALSGTDYGARSGQVQIIAGATTAAIPLTVLGDDVPEDTKTFHLRLAAPAGVALTANDLVIHILDDAICFLEVAPPDIVTTSAGGSESLSVTTRDGCEWSVSTPDAWIGITSPVNNTGSGTIALQIAPFDAPPGVFERSGSVAVTLADPMQTITVPVDQDGDCEFSIDPAARTLAVAGGNGTFTVDASVPECAWTVTSPAPWITILSPLAPVFGDGTVSYQVDANDDQVDVETGTRSIALASEQFTHTVSQDGCTYALDSNSIAAAAGGDMSYFVDLDTQGVCRWTAVSHASWILIQDGASGTGEGTVEVFVLDNPTVQARVGTVSIGDEILTVTQDGLQCDYALSPPSLAACPGGRAFALDVTATDGCTWTLHSDATWTELASGSSGTGSDQAQGLIDVNLSELARTASVQLRAQNIGIATTSVMQEGYLTYELFDTRPADWSYQPDAAWSAASGNLIGSAPAQSTVTALDQSSTCRECEIAARVAVSTASSNASEVLTVLGWYRDAANHVGFAMDEFSNRWVLFQRINGTRFSVMADVGQILPNAFYDVRLVFDGATFVAELGGQPLLQMPLQGDSPSGRAGLLLTGGNGRVSELRVNQVAASGVPVLPTEIFASSFEPNEAPVPPDAPNTSQCRLED